MFDYPTEAFGGGSEQVSELDAQKTFAELEATFGTGALTEVFLQMSAEEMRDRRRGSITADLREGLRNFTFQEEEELEDTIEELPAATKPRKSLNFIDETKNFMGAARGRRASTSIINPFVSPRDVMAPMHTPQAPYQKERRISAPVEEVIVCPWPECNKIFNRVYNLKSHYKTHELNPERPFVCGTCRQAFARNHDLKRHQRSHADMRPYTCETCNKSFTRSDALHRHQASGSCCKRRRNSLL